MPAVTFPVLALSEKITFGELPELFKRTAQQLAAQKLPNAILLLEVCAAPQWVHGTIKPSENPERMIIMAFEPKSRDAIAQALEVVKKRQPPPLKQKARANITAKPNTPLKSIFRQMGEIPLTMFSLTHSNNPESSLFFIQTAATIAEFRRELPNVVIS